MAHKSGAGQERFGRPFTKSEFREAAQEIAGGRLDFAQEWRHLSTARRIVRYPDNGTWMHQRNPRMDAIRTHFRGHLGVRVTPADLKQVSCTAHLPGPTIRAALQMLAAEGYRVLIRKRNRTPRALYQVFPPREKSRD